MSFCGLSIGYEKYDKYDICKKWKERWVNWNSGISFHWENNPIVLRHDGSISKLIYKRCGKQRHRNQLKKNCQRRRYYFWKHNDPNVRSLKMWCVAVQGKASGKKINEIRAKMIPSRDDTRSENMKQKQVLERIVNWSVRRGSHSFYFTSLMDISDF